MESLSRPIHRRKLSNTFKNHPYDGVFTTTTTPGQKFGAPNYSEIFGASRTCCSIPVLDLSVLQHSRTINDDFKKINYSNIFGGFNDDNDDDIALPYDQLFIKPKKIKRSTKTRTASEGTDQFSPNGRHKESTCEATNQSFDGPKHFNLSYHKTGQRSRDGSNGMTQIAQLHAVPGFTHFIDESSHLQKTEGCQRAPFVNSDGHRNRSLSGEIHKVRDRNGDFQASKAQSSDVVHRNRSFSGEIFTGHARNGDSHVPKKQSSDGHRNMHFSGEIFKEARDRNGDFHVPKKQSSDGQCDMRFREEIFKEGHDRKGNLHEPKKQSSDGHRDRHFSGEIFKEGHDRNADLHVSKNQSADEIHLERRFSGKLFNGRGSKENIHAPKKQSADGAVKVTSGSSWDAFHFNDKFYSAHDEFDGRSSSTEGASTSSPMANDIKARPNKSKFSGPDSKLGTSERGVCASNTSPPSSDEELDANSAAAISAATLKKAIEKAQESIRLAKELMERKQEGVPASQKRRSKVSLKSKDSRVECSRKSNTGNAIELHQNIGTGLPPFAEVGRGLLSSIGDFASYFNLKEHQWIAGKAKLNTQAEHVEAAQGNIEGTWFPEVVRSTEENTETLASQQAESKNYSQQSLENKRHVNKLKGMNTTSELGEGPDHVKSMGDIKPTLSVHGKVEAPEQYKDTSDSALMKDYEKCVNSEVTNEYCFSEEKANCSTELKSENMKNNLESTLDERWSFKTLQDSQETNTEEKVGFHEMENHDILYNNRDTPSGNETVNHEDVECRLVAEKSEDVHVVEENNSRLRRSSDEEETVIMCKEPFLWVENEEKPQHGSAREGIENRQEDFQGGQETWKWSNGIHECELSENKTSYSQKKESERKREGSEIEGLQKISVEPCQYEAMEEIEKQADKFTQNRKTESSQEAEETENKMEASDKSEDDQETGVAPGVADKSETSVNEADHKDSPSLSEVQEACDPQVENNDIGISLQAIDFGGTQGVSEDIYKHEECEKDRVIEESSSLRDKEILEAANDLQNASGEDTSEGEVRDTRDLSSEEAKEVNHGSSCMSSVDTLPSERVIFETKSFSNVVPDNVSDNESHFAPEAHPSEEPENTTSTEMNLEQDCMDETGTDPELCSSLDEGDDLWVHAHVENEETVVENEETVKGDSIVADQVEKNEDIEAAKLEKKSIENSEELECSSLPGEFKDNEPLHSDEEIKAALHEEESNLSQKAVVREETKESSQKEVEDKNDSGKPEVDMRQREREKDRIAVERAIREARERAFAEARERAERAAVERATAEVRQRVMAEAREKREKASASNKVSTDKASIEAKLKAERAAVERATAEARERALEKALSQKSTAELRSQTDRHGVERFASAARENGLKHSLSSSDLDKFDGSTSESAQRRKARLERHQRIMERAANALAEKNRRDLLAQKEQTERNRLAESLDAEIKRWASGKEGNLRALLSTLQYILGPSSGWQPISLTEIITTAAVKKAYRKATLYVHPDKLQQRGASIQQKYVCEKIFDLLKAAWNRFNSEER